MANVQCPNCGAYYTEEQKSRITGCLGAIAAVVGIWLGIELHWIAGLVLFLLLGYGVIKIIPQRFKCAKCGYSWSVKS